jgi:hypothetical protein
MTHDMFYFLTNLFLFGLNVYFAIEPDGKWSKLSAFAAGVCFVNVLEFLGKLTTTGN